MNRIQIMYTKEEAEEILSQYTPEQQAELKRLADVFLDSLASVPSQGSLEASASGSLGSLEASSGSLEASSGSLEAVGNASSTSNGLKQGSPSQTC